jgi:hypothetical protein
MDEARFSRSQIASAAFICVAALIAIASTDSYAVIDDNTAMYLDCGKMILSGKVPYIDFFDLNPPFIMYFSALPAALASLSGGTVVAYYRLLVNLFVLLSLSACARLLSLNPLATFKWPVLAGLVAFNLATYSHGSFGERDHLFVIFTVPFLFLRLLRYHKFTVGKNASFALGLAAGLAICIKPQCILLPVLVELVLFALNSKTFARTRNRLELVGMSVFPLAYAILLISIPAQSRAYLFNELLPLLSSSYCAYNIPVRESLLLASYPQSIINGLGFGLVFALGLVALKLNWKLKFADSSVCNPSRSAYGLVVAWCFSGYIIYVMQSKGWHYQMLTAESGFIVLSAMLLSDLCRGRWTQTKDRPRTAPKLWQSVAGLLVWLCLVNPLLAHGTSSLLNGSVSNLAGVGGVSELAAMAHETASFEHSAFSSADSMLILSTETSPYCRSRIDSSLPKSALPPASRYLWCYPLVLYQYSLAHAGASEAQVLREKIKKVIEQIAQDVHKNKPSVIALQVKGRSQSYFKIDSLFLENVEFQSVLADYSMSPQTTEHFILYRKKESSPGSFDRGK